MLQPMQVSWLAPCLAFAAASAVECSAATLLARRAAAGSPCFDSATHNTLSAAGPADSSLYAASACAPEAANLAAPAPILPRSPAADSMDDALSSNSPASIFASTADVNSSSANLLQCSFDAASRLTKAADQASDAVPSSLVLHASAAAVHASKPSRMF